MYDKIITQTENSNNIIINVKIWVNFEPSQCQNKWINALVYLHIDRLELGNKHIYLFYSNKKT